MFGTVLAFCVTGEGYHSHCRRPVGGRDRSGAGTSLARADASLIAISTLVRRRGQVRAVATPSLTLS
jgi:hypothetical protein